MKKIINIMALTILSAIFCCCTTNSVRAETLEMRYQDNVYYVHVNDDGTGYSSYQLAMFYVDGKLAYCVEPGLAIYSTNYNVGNWDVTSLSPEQRKRIELIGYYGYEYPSHQGNVKYYMAAQELIWKVAKPLSATWSTEKRGGGQIINIEAEKNEIERLISSHLTKPDFNNKTINGTVGDTIYLVDSNNVLSEFSVYDASSNEVQINGNRLDIKVNRTGENQIKFIRKNYDNDINLVYYNSNSQKLAHTRLSDPVTAKLNLNIVAGKVKINKMDKDTKNNKAQGEASLNGAVYEIYNSNDEYITSISTDEMGQGKSINLPNLGRYYLKEKSSSKGYLVDDTKYYFDMSLDNINPTINVYEQVIKRSFEFTKIYSSDKTGIMTPEKNIKFGIYDKNGKLVCEKVTDDEGKLYVTLPYGSYTLKQLTTTKNYEKMQDYNFEVREVGKTINKVFGNSEIKAKLRVVKIDSDSKKVIPRAGIKFKIFDVNNNKYVCQTTDKTQCEFETNKNGYLITQLPLKSGIYKLEEVDQRIYGYLWNKESHIFEIGEDSKLITDSEFGILFDTKFSNKQVKGEVLVRKIGEKLVIENNSYHYEQINLDGVVYELYASEDIFSQDGTLIYKKGKLIGTYKTLDGSFKISNLYIGKYYLKEKSTVGNHVIDDKKHEFEITYKDQYTQLIKLELTFKNYLKKGTLEFTKTDVSGNPLPNTKIQIFTNEDGEDSKLIFEGVTDENGKIIIKDLFVGKFKLIESEAPQGYILNPTPQEFEIKEDGEIIKSNMTNEKEIIDVPNTLKKEYYFLEIGCVLLATLGVGVIIYANKRKK